MMKYIVLGMLVTGLLAGVVGLLLNGLPPAGTRPEYADTDGDGFVSAQGDPLWDEHYAGKVNVPNSEAKENLGQAEVYQADAELQRAQAHKVEADTMMTKLLIGFICAIVLFCAFFIGIGMLASRGRA